MISSSKIATASPGRSFRITSIKILLKTIEVLTKCFGALQSSYVPWVVAKVRCFLDDCCTGIWRCPPLKVRVVKYLKYGNE
ncbi:hypothetical protein pipiens_020215, partial [Culex pipiens pipiens]